MKREIKFHIYESLSSTQEVAKTLKKEPSKLHAVIACEQTQGKGTFGKSWFSPKDAGVYLTLAFESSKKEDLQTLSHLTACAGCICLDDIHPKIKWPNDLMVEEKKIGGIITEIQGTHIYAGIGINLYKNKKLDTLDQPATSYEAYKKPKDPIEFAKMLAEVYLKLLEDWEHHGFKKIKPLYLKYCLYFQNDVVIDTPTGLLKGKLIDISDEGYPILKMGTETITVTHLGHINPLSM